ncbi:MAG: hypothetical protein JWN30_773 [Bacilli bacterium]|nr:hypothetical protein [Bacilli bacterium]
MAIFTAAFVTIRGGWHEIHAFSAKAWLFIVLAGISGAVSWLAYFAALKTGAASKVAPIDRLSVVVTLLLAWIVLGEKLSITMGFGIVLMAAGSLLILKG